eukprot:1146760-Pelagomonas_calceolata.AAC.1
MRVARSTRGSKQLGSRDRRTWQLGSRTWTRARRTHSTAARTAGSRPQAAHFQRHSRARNSALPRFLTQQPLANG